MCADSGVIDGDDLVDAHDRAEHWREQYEESREREARLEAKLRGYAEVLQELATNIKWASKES